MANLTRLRDDIIIGRYKPSRGIAFMVFEPVQREIFAAPFRDRVVHHFLFNMSADWWDRRLIRDSYSCRKNKGTLDGILRLHRHIMKVSQNNTRKAYVIKLDIQGYFMSLSRAALFDNICWGLTRQFGDGCSEGSAAKHDLLKFLWHEIIFDDPIRDVRRRGSLSDWDTLPQNKSLFCQPPGQGIVIGNLSSQLLSNIYLNKLDRYVLYKLGYKHYGRYVDDFYLIVSEEEYPQALKDITKIEKFLRYELGLTLHPRKRYIQEVRKGVSFLGVVVYPGYIVPGKRFKRNFFRSARKVQQGLKDPDTIASYMGLAKYINSVELCARVLESIASDFEY